MLARYRKFQRANWVKKIDLLLLWVFTPALILLCTLFVIATTLD